MTHTATASGDWRRLPGQVRRFFDIDISLYTASGEVPDPSKFQPFNRIDQIIPAGHSDNGHAWRWDGTKVRAFKADTSEGTASITMTDGRALVTEEWGNILGATFAAQVTDSGSGAVNDERVLALRVTQDETVSSFAAQPDHARNVVLTLEANGGAATLPTAGTITVNGTLDGVVVSSVFDISATTGDFGTGTIAENNFRWAIGAEVMDTVTDVVVDVDGNEANLRYALGIGTKLHLAMPLDTGVEADDVHRVLKNDSVVASGTYVLDSDENALDPGADLADNDEVHIGYFTDSDAAGGSITTAGSAKLSVEASSMDDVGTCRCEVVGV